MGQVVTIQIQPRTLEVPEVEKGVGCDVDSYLLAPDGSMDDRIARAKDALGSRLVVLGHHYQRDEVIRFADFTGDSLKLSQQAAASSAEYIVFCGVHFMAESADILRQPHQQVVLPDLNAGCSMSDMADISQVEAAWRQLEEEGVERVVPVTYMNTAAAIKSFTGLKGGAVCTSSNAAGVIRWAFEKGDRVLFLPDEHLGRNVAARMGVALGEMVVWDPYQPLGGHSVDALRNARMILWKGYCSVHQRFTPEQVDRARAGHPCIRVIAHPECRYDVCQKADEIGSTEVIRHAVEQSPAGTKWAIGTEIHLVNRLAANHPDKRIISLDPNVCVCTTMFRITPQHLCWALENLVAGNVVNCISVGPETRRWAQVALERMLEIR